MPIGAVTLVKSWLETTAIQLPDGFSNIPSFGEMSFLKGQNFTEIQPTHRKLTNAQGQGDKHAHSSIIFEPAVWPHLLWSVTLTWGLSSVVPPGVWIRAAPHCALQECSNRCHKGVAKVFLPYFAHEKFLQVYTFLFLIWYPCSLKKKGPEKKYESEEGRTGSVVFGERNKT